MEASKYNKYEENPFKRLGNPVFGDQFVGRQAAVKRLQNECTNRNFAIQGLPKVGKTSLTYQSVVHLKETVKSDSPLCVVDFNTGSCTTPKDFFKSLVFQVHLTLKAFLTTIQAHDDLKALENIYSLVEGYDFEPNVIEPFFKSGIQSMSIHLLLLIDEFDKVRNIGFSGHNFSMLREILQVHNITGIVMSKRSIYDLEDWTDDPDNRAPSTFYEIFTGNTIHLEPFNDQEMSEYWARLEPYFEAIGFPFDEEYKNRAIYYAGHFPHKLNVFNSRNYETFKDTGHLVTEEDIRAEMKSTYDSEMNMLESVDLLEASIQAIIGPVYELTEKQMDSLKEYGFLREVSESKKYEIIGTEIGVTENKGGELVGYVAPSDYFTKYMKSLYVNQPSYWKEWEKVFRGMREIAKRSFVDTFGDNWFEDAASDPRLCDFISALSRQINNDKRDGISVSPPIEYLNESDMGSLLQLHWKTFKNIFTSCADFFSKYYYVVKIRNHPGHLNDRYLSEEDLVKANKYLVEFKHCIDTWLSNNSNEKLELLTPFQFIEGETYNGGVIVESTDEKGKTFKCVQYEGFPYPLRINGQRPQCNVGDIAIFVAKKNGKYWVATQLIFPDTL